MNKKILAIIMTLLLLIIAGCGSNASDEKMTTEALLSTTFNVEQADKITNLVKNSDLTDEDKDAFYTITTSNEKDSLNGKTVKDINDLSKKNIADKKAEEEKKKIEEEKKKAQSKINTTVAIASAYKCDSIFDDHIKDEKGYNVRLDLTITNKSPKRLKAVQVEYRIFNDFKEEIGVYKTDFTKLDIPSNITVTGYYVYTTSGRGSEFGQQVLNISDTNINAEVRVLKAVYDDGTMESIIDNK